jgi:hypothetical protein
MHVPWTLQLAHGWTSLGITVNSIALLVLVPLIVALTSRYGAAGGAMAWALLNTGYLAVIPAIMHRRVLKGEALRWLLLDVGRPTTAALAVAVIGYVPLYGDMPRFVLVPYLGLVWVSASLAAACSVPDIRNWIIRQITVPRRVLPVAPALGLSHHE